MKVAVIVEDPAPVIVTVAPDTVATPVVPEEYVNEPANAFPSTPVTLGGVNENDASPYVFETPDHDPNTGAARFTVTTDVTVPPEA